MQKSLTVREKRETLKSFLLANRQDIQESLPRLMSAERLIGNLFTTIAMKPELMECSPRSLIVSLLHCGSLGLYPGPLGLIYFVPFKSEVTVIPGYKGLIQLARRSGEIEKIGSGVVWDGDEFAFELGPNSFLHHVPNGERKEFGKFEEIQWAYSYYTLKGSDKADIEVMSRNNIEWHRERYSKAATKGPWVTDWPAMAMKTCIRKNLKFGPQATEIQSAITLDEAAESQMSQMDMMPGLSDELEEKVEKTFGKESESVQVAGPVELSPENVPAWAPKALAGKPLKELTVPQLNIFKKMLENRLDQDKDKDNPDNAFIQKDKALLVNILKALDDQKPAKAEEPKKEKPVEKKAEEKPKLKAEPKETKAEPEPSTADTEDAKLSPKEEASLLCDQLKELPNGSLRLIEVMDRLRIRTIRSAWDKEMPAFIEALLQEINQGEENATSEN